MRILAVDDDPQALRYVRDALVNSGYSPIVTPDAEDALRLMEVEASPTWCSWTSCCRGLTASS